MAKIEPFMLEGSKIFHAFKVHYDRHIPVHVDDHGFKGTHLNPLFVINPVTSHKQTIPEKGEGIPYQGGQICFPTLFVKFESDEIRNQGIHFDLKEGDLLLFNFSKIAHYNAKIIPEEKRTIWKQISVTIYANEEILKHDLLASVYENSDPEDDDYFMSSTATGSLAQNGSVLSDREKEVEDNTNETASSVPLTRTDVEGEKTRRTSLNMYEFFVHNTDPYEPSQSGSENNFLDF